MSGALRTFGAGVLAIVLGGSLPAQSLDAALIEAAGRYAADPRTVRALIARGANPNAAGPDGSTPLMAAMQYGELPVLRVLLGAGADPNRPVASSTVLCAAIVHGAITPEAADDLVVLLLRHGADPNLRCQQGRAPLSHAIMRHADFRVGVLIAAGARVNDADDDGTPLIVSAARYGPSPIVRRLLDAGADVNAKTRWGWTALAAATNTTIAAMLLERGAKLDASDLETALIIHRDQFRLQVAALISGAGASRR